MGDERHIMEGDNKKWYLLFEKFVSRVTHFFENVLLSLNILIIQMSSQMWYLSKTERAIFPKHITLNTSNIRSCLCSFSITSVLLCGSFLLDMHCLRWVIHCVKISGDWDTDLFYVPICYSIDGIASDLSFSLYFFLVNFLKDFSLLIFSLPLFLSPSLSLWFSLTLPLILSQSPIIVFPPQRFIFFGLTHHKLELYKAV